MTVTGLDASPVIAMASSAAAWQPATATAASAIHLICCRTSRPPDRYRIARETAATPRSTVPSAARPSRVPIKIVDSTGPSDLIPSGLGNTKDVPPGAGSPISLGCTTNPTIVSAVASRPSPAHGRQRGEGSLPVGNSISMKPIPVKTGMKVHSASRPTSSGAGKVPGWATPNTA